MGFIERELCPDATQDRAAPWVRGNALPWAALVVKPQYERAVEEGLERKGIESFLPMYWTTHRWSDRAKRLQLPLFPGYVFCRSDRSNRVPVLRTPGVRLIVSFGTELAPVPEEEIENVRQMVASGSFIEPWPFLRIGQRVRVHDGPLTGMEGILSEVRNAVRVVVGLELLQRSVAVHLNKDQIRPLN